MNTIDLAADIGADPAAPNIGAYNLSAGELRNETSGDAYRLLERYGAQMLLAEADDGAQLLYVREEGSAIWQSGYSPVGKGRIWVMLCEWIVEVNTEYEEALRFAYARTPEVFAGANEVERTRSLGRELKRLKAARDSEHSLREVAARVAVVAQNLRKHGEDEFGLTRCRLNALDANTRYIGATNGVIDLEAGELLRGADGAAALVTKTLPDEFKADARHEDVDALFDHCAPWQRDHLLDHFACALFGRQSVFLMLYGQTKGGKSTLVNALRHSLGGYASAAGSGAHSPKRGGAAANAHTEDVKALMPPYRLAVVSEAEKARLDIARIKSATGEDPITYRGLYEPNRTNTPTAMLLIVANEPPALSLTDDAMYERLRAMEYAQIPAGERKQRLRHDWKPDAEGSAARRQAMVALLVKRAVKMEPGALPPLSPEAEAERVKLQQRQMDALTEWLQSAVKTGNPRDKLSTNALWEAACAAMGADVGADAVEGRDQRALTDEFKALHLLPNVRQMRVDGRKRKGWVGITLPPAEPEGEDDAEFGALS